MKNEQAKTMSGGQALIECLRREKVRHVFNVPGESFLAALDAFYDTPEIQVITNRQEGGACYMAEAYAKATRKVGVCFVTRGPGATNASIGVHCAAQDSTPLVLLVGQVPRINRGREAWQEMDHERFFGSMAKWVVEIDHASKVPEVVTRAFHVARSGRPGPVVISLPEDMLVEQAAMTFADPPAIGRPHPDPAQIDRTAERLREAERPVLLLGSGVQYAGAREDAIRIAERYALPTVTSWRRNDAFPNSHPHYAGNLALGPSPAQKLMREADLVLIVGDRMSEITTGNYALPLPGQPVIQIDIDAASIGRTFTPEVAILSDAKSALQALQTREGLPDGARKDWIGRWRGEYEAFSTPSRRDAETVSMEKVLEDMREVIPGNAVITVDSGNASAWVQRFYRYDAEDSLLGPIVGSMGYGLPAAIAAKLAHPERTVIGTCGDGAFMMTVQELATAVQYEVNIVQIVFNNGTLGSIRMHQERNYPERVIATDLRNPDFAALARAYGAEGIRVEKEEDFKAALKQALATEGPVVMDVLTDKENISVFSTLTELRGTKSGSKRR